ncbi:MULTISPECIES: VOC family protein [Bacillaceae]|uniref:VOC family protein n=1 Tax=Bacillaceae TaxID=186817 RepID=UPI000BEDC66C|nr:MULTISPECIES: VOC family protein [unclassified Bacillus (in: firmicutes)]PEC50650.1 glyoxalase [Bacillus sp. AFS096315]PFM76856.1 glyoxalase [Bacillus sp. AFS077874]
MNFKKLIHSSLKVLLVSNLEKSKEFYQEVLGCEVTEWWVIREGFSGLGIKLLQANSPEDVQPNKPAKDSNVAFDLYCYVEDWSSLDELYEEFREKGAEISIEPWIDYNAGPWKEFAIKDIDNYCIGFGGTDKN